MILYLFPTEMEAAPFRRLSPDAHVVISGVGMVATAATIAKLLAEGRLGRGCTVLLAGIAGSYTDSLSVGEVVEVVRERVVELPSNFYAEYDVKPSTGLRGVVSNTVHCMAEASGSDIENMEGATLFAMAEHLGFRAVEIRAVSNRVGEPFASWRVAEAVETLADELLGLNKVLDYE